MGTKCRDTRNQTGVYGTKGLADAANVPGARYRSICWTDSNGNLWLFGGLGYDSGGSYGRLNDLWEIQVFNQVDLKEFVLLAQYWKMNDCGDSNDCAAADWYVDSKIDILDLQQLALSWLGEEIIYHTP